VPYEDRYCAYVDILGFGELVEKLDQGQTPFEALQELLKKIHNPPPSNASGFERADFRAQSISDAVALSGADNIVGLSSVIHAINRLAVDLLHQGFFIRGAIVKDKLHHDDKMVFGRALVRAYRLESNVVRYPRVMVTREVVETIRTSRDEKAVGRLLRRAEDGPMFLHVLRAIEMEALPSEVGELMTQSAADRVREKLSPFIGLADHIQRRFDEATDIPEHFEKVKWFANYWNETIDMWGVKGFRKVTGPGVDPKPAVWGP
jgi:hypothetical protein